MSPARQEGLLFEYMYAVRLLESGLYEEAIPQFSVVIRRLPTLAKAWHGRGLAYYHEEQLDFAMEDFDEAIARKPEFADAYKNRGVLYKDLGEKEKAIADLERALSLYDEFRDAREIEETRSLLNELRE